VFVLDGWKRVMQKKRSLLGSNGDQFSPLAVIRSRVTCHETMPG
jgi:hypothetical protein